MKTKYPKTVPLLNGRQFTCERLFDNEKRKKCCLLGWAVEVFTDRGPETARCEMIRESSYNTPEFEAADKYIEESYNSVPQVVKKAIAKAAYSIDYIRIKISECNDFESKSKFVSWVSENIPDINDAMDFTGKDLAKIWNKAMEILGYTEAA